MKKLCIFLVLMFIATNVFAATWTFKINQIVKTGDKVRFVVTLYADGNEYAGREMTFNYDDLKDLTKVQIKDVVVTQVQYIIQQDEPDYLLKTKMSQYLNVEIAVP